MREDQLSRQWRIIRAIETNPSGLTVAEIPKISSLRNNVPYYLQAGCTFRLSPTGGFAAPRFLSGFTLSTPGQLRRSGLAGAWPP